MAVLEILKFPDPRLRTKATPVTKVDAAFKRVIEDMYETMYDANGVGLAATQVNIHQLFFVVDVSESRKEPKCVINPEIISKEGELVFDGEGCLSVPGAYDKVGRYERVKMRGMDLDGKTFEWDADGLLAHVIQHELDHLNGMLFVDHLSRLKQERIRKKMEKMSGTRES